MLRASAPAPSDPGSRVGQALRRGHQPCSCPGAAHPSQAALAEPEAEERPGGLVGRPRGPERHGWQRPHAQRRWGGCCLELLPSGSLQARPQGPRAQLVQGLTLQTSSLGVSRDGTPPAHHRPPPNAAAAGNPREPARTRPGQARPPAARPSSRSPCRLTRHPRPVSTPQWPSSSDARSIPAAQ